MISNRVSSGIAGLDDILAGGFVQNRLHLIEGTPGTGKTTLALQFVFAGRDLGEKTLYVSMSETRSELEAVATAHGWTLDGIELCELVPPDAEYADENRQTMFHSAEVELSETMRRLFAEIDRIKPARIVLDSLSEMRLLAQNPLRYRRQIFALKHFLASRKSTVLLLDDMTSENHDLQLHSIAHCVVTLEQLQLDYGADRRRVRISKMRGVNFRGGYHDYIITTGRLIVFPRLVASEHREKHPKEIAASGSPQLDSLLGGGLRRGTSALLIGPAGSGKSSVALAFAQSAAKRGEQATVFAFDEGTESIQERARGLGMDIMPFRGSHEIDLHEINPAEMSPGEFTSLVRRSVTEQNASVVIIDSLNGLMHSMPEERFLMMELHELLTFLNSKGVLTIMVLAQYGLVGTMQTPVDVSYLSDAVLVMRFFEAGGRVRKAISVIKKRLGAHEDTIREFRLSGDGLQVGEPLRDFHGIMTGIPAYLGDQSMLRQPQDETGREPAAGAEIPGG